MDTQFQLGLELTNVLTPVTSAITSLASGALVKAIKQAGSDALTELELASILGRNRIDASMQLGFRQVVGRSDQTKLSHFLDIMLESGAGPTVQNALQNPELLSMVIQLSALLFVHESDTLASALVEAIERNLRELKADLTKVPDYASLCGTLRVCKQETARFLWSEYYDAVERRIESSIDRDRNKNRRRSPVSLRHGIADRELPFPVLQILLLSLHTLQRFPDERLLNIECTSGISTAIVWCYYVLGLNVKLILHGHEIDFGEPSANVFIRQSTSQKSYASLMHPKDSHEPLFHLISDEGDPRIRPELRRNARGFGHEIIKQLSLDREDLEDYPNWVMHQSVRVLRVRAERQRAYMPNESISNQLRRFGKWSTAESYNFTEDNIIVAGKFLFDLDRINERSIKEGVGYSPPRKKHWPDLSSLVVLLLSLARVQPEDLQDCRDLPLSTQAQKWLKNDEPCVQWIVEGNLHMVALGLTKSFEVLSRFLQGPNFSREMDDRTVLVTACGWSLYFNSINCSDPAELFVSTLRIVFGIPARNGVRKTRIIDGPSELLFSPSEALVLKNPWNRCVEYWSGLSLSNRGRVLIGYDGPDAFQITQTFEWQYGGSRTQKHLLGFREMLEICLKFSQFLPCQCDRDPLSLYDVAGIYVSRKDLVDDQPPSGGSEVLRVLYCLDGQNVDTFSDCDHSTKLPERNKPLTDFVFCAQNGSKAYPKSEAWLFYVSHNPAARWMELSDIYPRLVDGCDEDPLLLLRGPETCLQCAFEAVVPSYDQHSTYGSQDDGTHVAYVLL